MARPPDILKCDIAIIGCGIGGAATALALQTAGITVEVFEQASELREVGGGIVVREPSRQRLEQWGLLDELRRLMVPVEALEILDKNSNVVATAPAAIEGGETFGAHRADVHGALVSRLDRSRLHLDHRVVSIENHADYAEAVFENGRRVHSGLLIGADGLRSVARRLIDMTPMNFQNQITNRTIAPASLLPTHIRPDRIRVWQDSERRIIMLPIRGGREVTINAALPAAEPPEKLWSLTPPEEIIPQFEDFDPLIACLMEAGTRPMTTHPVYDREPIERWIEGRVVILGDAAHPMTPMNGQGANQAMQDAGALADALVTHSEDLPAALLAYQTLRAPATAKIQMLSRKPVPALASAEPRANVR
jgi:salicylate hydroxylase